MFTYKDYIYEIYKEKSFTIASQKLYLSQPALSATVKKVEKKLGVELFDRSVSPLRLTEAGKAYIEAVEQIYAIEDNLKNKIYDISNLKSGSILLGGANFISTCVLPDILKEYSLKYSGIKVNLIESSSKDLKEKALNGLIDLIIDYDFDENLFTSYPIKDEHIYLSLSKNSSTYLKFKDYAITQSEIKKGEQKNKKAIKLDLLKNEDFLLLKKGNDMYLHAIKLFKEYNIQPNVKFELDQLRTSYELSCKGLGLAFVTDTLLLKSENKNVVYFKLDSKNAVRKLKIAHRKNIYVSYSMIKFISTIQDFYK